MRPYSQPAWKRPWPETYPPKQFTMTPNALHHRLATSCGFPTCYLVPSHSNWASRNWRSKFVPFMVMRKIEYLTNPNNRLNWIQMDCRTDLISFWSPVSYPLNSSMKISNFEVITPMERRVHFRMNFLKFDNFEPKWCYLVGVMACGTRWKFVQAVVATTCTNLHGEI